MKIKKGFLLKKVGEEFVVVPVDSKVVKFNAMINLNQTGSELWKMLEKNTTVEAMIAQFVKDYDISEEVAKGDVNEFINKLREQKLIEE